MIKKPYLAAGLLLLPLCNTAIAENEPYLESDGEVIIEVENTQAGEGWSLETALPEYSGNGYYLWVGPDYTGESKAGLGDTIQYPFRISNPGNYEFRLRSYIAEGESNTESNDVWVRFPTGSNVADEQPLDGWTKVYMSQLGKWSWSTKAVDHVGAVVRQYFPAGDHVIEVSGRSKGFAIDKLALYKYEDISFSDRHFTESGESAGGGDGQDNPDTPVPPVVISEHELESGICTDNSISLAPVDAVSVSSEAMINDGYLEFSGTGDSALLKFDLTDIPVSRTAATLQFFPEADQAGLVTLVYAADHSDWDNTSLVEDLPDSAVKLAEQGGDYLEQQLLELTIDHTLLATGQETFILSLDDNAPAIRIHLNDESIEPRLLISGGDTFCEELANNQAQSEEEPEPEEEAESGETPETSGETDSGSEGGSDSNGGGDTTEQAENTGSENLNVGQAGSSSDEPSAGAYTVELLLLIAVFFGRLGNIRRMRIMQRR
ncbi:MAG: hypothetical protein KDJ38_06380 [Gammaproteobacteria bacterium]|nr:hypothetical protein [Gammaproteobacteria bacterium]